MGHKPIRAARTAIVVAAILAISAALPAAAEGPVEISPTNQKWAAYISKRVDLTSPQNVALQDYLETSAKATSVPGESQDQIRAMSLVEWSEYWAQHMANELTSLKADAQALRRFYALLSPQQKAAFDEATRRQPARASVAADVISTPAPDKPDYSLPAFANPDWLIKPTADNLARVYPSAALQKQIKGRVVLHCLADEDGYLKDCNVVEESPIDQGFGNAALEVTAYMRFQPATRYGVPFASGINVPIRFDSNDF